MEGVAQVQVDREEQGNCKLTVIGRVDPNHVLKALRRLTHKKVELLPVPQVQDDVVPQPSQPEPVNVHNVLRHDHDDQEASMLPRANFLGDPNYTTAFSEDSPNACPIMWSIFHSITVIAHKFVCIRANVVFFSIIECWIWNSLLVMKLMIDFEKQMVIKLKEDIKARHTLILF